MDKALVAVVLTCSRRRDVVRDRFAEDGLLKLRGPSICLSENTLDSSLLVDPLSDARRFFSPSPCPGADIAFSRSISDADDVCSAIVNRQNVIPVLTWRVL